MSDKNIWLGPRGHEMWVPAPSVNPDFSSVGWNSKTQYLNGGAGVRSSYASHKEYVLSFNPTSRDRLRPITDMAAGMYGSGLIYWTDPVAADKNVLPEHWAFPGQAGLDGPVLIGDVRPNLTVETVANALGYPALSAVYTLGATSQSIYLPIPPDCTAWFGAHGSTDGWGGVRVRPVLSNGSYGTAVFPEFLSVSDPTLVNVSFAGSGFSGIEIDLIASTISTGPFPALDAYPSIFAIPGAATPATKIVLSGLIAQMLPTGATPPTGRFISGQGNSGCKFEGHPTLTPYSAPMDLVGMTAKLTEVGGWL